MEKVYRFFQDLTERITGMNTRAPEIKTETIKGPSIRAAVVNTRAQILAHSNVRMTHWERESGFFMGWTEFENGCKKAEIRNPAVLALLPNLCWCCIIPYKVDYWWFSFLATMASIHAMAVMFTMSRTELSISVK